LIQRHEEARWEAIGQVVQVHSGRMAVHPDRRTKADRDPVSEHLTRSEPAPVQTSRPVAKRAAALPAANLTDQLGRSETSS
jgi:hypothetical protein